MFFWALASFLVALAAGAMWIGGFAGAFASLAELAFFVGIISFVVLLLLGVTKQLDLGRDNG